MKSRWRLALAAAALLGWIGVLGYTAVMKSRAPTVSHIQPAVASTAVVVELGDARGTAAVVEKLWGDGPEKGQTVEINNMTEVKGYVQPGRYLVYLTNKPRWVVVPAQRSPGTEGIGPPLIYAWSADVEAQEKKLRPPAQ